MVNAKLAGPTDDEASSLGKTPGRIPYERLYCSVLGHSPFPNVAVCSCFRLYSRLAKA